MDRAANDWVSYYLGYTGQSAAWMMLMGYTKLLANPQLTRIAPNEPQELSTHRRTGKRTTPK